MKKEGLLVLSLFFAIVVMMGFASAISSDIKPSYERSETAIIELSGSIVEPIKFENVKIKRVNVNVPVEYDVKNINGKYYIWFISPSETNNYTLLLQDVSSYVEGKVRIINYTADFRVEGNLSSYNIKPGFVITDKDFEINAYSTMDEDYFLETDYAGNNGFLIGPGENKLEFKIDSLDKDLKGRLKIGKYSLPVNIDAEDPQVIVRPRLNIEPNRIRSTRLYSDARPYYFKVYNSNNDSELVNVEYNASLFEIVPGNNFTLSANQSIYLNVSIKDKSRTGYQESIWLVYGDYRDNIELKIELTNLSNETATLISNATGNVVLYYCSELNGKVCQSSEICSGEVKSSIEGSCCVGTCSLPPAKSYAWIGYLIGAIVLIGAAYMWYKYYKVGPEKNALEKRVKNIESN